MRRYPLSYGAAAELVPLMRDELKLCRVRPGETVAIQCDYQSPPHYPAALVGAALSLQAYPFQLWVGAAASEEEAVRRAWESADLTVDLRPGAGLGATSLAVAALRAGRRILAISEPVDVLQRLFPDPDVAARAHSAAAALTAARTVEVTSRAGTELRFHKIGRPGVDQHGYSETPGRWDRWPSGRVLCAPEEESAEGRLVVAPGDLWLSQGRYTESPVTLTFQAGRLTGVEGDGPDGLLMRDWFARPVDAGATVLAGFSWGTDPRARWDRVGRRFAEPGGVMEAASHDGAVVVAFGDNTSPLLGGRNVTAARFAVALRDHTVALDGQAVIVDGKATFSLQA